MIDFKKIILAAGDIFLLYASLWLTLLIRYGSSFTTERWHQHFWPFSLVYFVWLIVFYIAGLYEIQLAQNDLKFYSTLLRSLMINTALSIAFFYFLPYGITPKTNLFLNLIIFSLILLLWRRTYNQLIKSSTLLNDILIIGKTKESQQLEEVIGNHPQFGFRIASQINSQDIQKPSDLLRVIKQNNIKTIVTAVNPRHDAHLVQALYYSLPLKIQISDLPSFYERILGRIPISSIEQSWFLENLAESQKNFYETSKRAFDLTASLFFGLISLPFYPLFVLAIKLDSPGPAFFTQKRIGQNGKTFTVIKFRSMLEKERVTRVGGFMRKTRLDELPQLWNIFLGQMSFVGPRPEKIEFVRELEKQIPYYQIRHIVRPGLTGWAQINFPHTYGASVQDSIEKLQYELYYIKHRSFILDLGTILKTTKIVLTGGGK